MPWDSDVDVMITESSIYYLAAYYNMSTFWFKMPAQGKEKGKGRNYLLEINPNHINREQTDTLNRIDARWIDTETGLFIDITAARYNLTHPQGEGMLSCKDGHEFRVWEDTPRGVAAEELLTMTLGYICLPAAQDNP